MQWVCMSAGRGQVTAVLTPALLLLPDKDLDPARMQYKDDFDYSGRWFPLSHGLSDLFLSTVLDMVYSHLLVISLKDLAQIRGSTMRLLCFLLADSKPGEFWKENTSILLGMSHVESNSSIFFPTIIWNQSFRLRNKHYQMPAACRCTFPLCKVQLIPSQSLSKISVCVCVCKSNWLSWLSHFDKVLLIKRLNQCEKLVSNLW